jgi:hypothetical protein
MACWQPSTCPSFNHATLAGHGIACDALGVLWLDDCYSCGGFAGNRPYGAARMDVDQVSFFKLFPVAFMPNLGDWTLEAHELLSKAAQVLIIVHVIAALKHQFWDKDGLLSRMRPM